jgi:hypothetical protein
LLAFVIGAAETGGSSCAGAAGLEIAGGPAVGSRVFVTGLLAFVVAAAETGGSSGAGAAGLGIAGGAEVGSRVFVARYRELMSDGDLEMEGAPFEST